MSQNNYKEALVYQTAADGTKYIKETFDTAATSFVSVEGTHPNITSISHMNLPLANGGTNSSVDFDAPNVTDYQGNSGDSANYQNMLTKHAAGGGTLESGNIRTYGGTNGTTDTVDTDRVLFGHSNAWSLAKTTDLFTSGEGGTGPGAHSHGSNYLLSNPGTTTTDVGYGITIGDPNHPNYQEESLEIVAYDGSANTLLVRVPWTSAYSTAAMAADFCTSIAVSAANGSGTVTKTGAEILANDIIAGTNGRLILIKTNVTDHVFTAAAADSRVTIVGYKHFVHQPCTGNWIEQDATVKQLTYSCLGVYADTATVGDVESTDYVVGTGISDVANLDVTDDYYMVSELDGNPTVTENHFTLTVKPQSTYTDDARLELVNSGGVTNANFIPKWWSPEWPNQKYNFTSCRSSGSDMENATISAVVSEVPGSLAVGTVEVGGTTYGSGTDPVAMILCHDVSPGS
tara:strand:- start:3798 stop:5174 length:1377 start_codon:yes stop_codon:yes gene_type:complete